MAKFPGVKAKHVDMCMYGSIHRKPPAFLTSAPWIEEVACSQVAPHVHVPLEGRVSDYASGNMVWLTELAAEYPEDWCKEAARSFLNFVQSGLSFGKAGSSHGRDMPINAEPSYFRGKDQGCPP